LKRETASTSLSKRDRINLRNFLLLDKLLKAFDNGADIFWTNYKLLHHICLEFSSIQLRIIRCIITTPLDPLEDHCLDQVWPHNDLSDVRHSFSSLLSVEIEPIWIGRMSHDFLSPKFGGIVNEALRFVCADSENPVAMPGLDSYIRSNICEQGSTLSVVHDA
jgi:hypothetical protein